MSIRFRSATLLAASFVVVALVACSSSEEEKSPEAAFCDSLASAYASCGGEDSCSTAIGADCTKLATLLNPSILAGARACLDDLACGDNPLGCLGAALADAARTPAQDQLATHYCASCSTVSGAACETVLLGTADVPGLASVLLPFGDGLVGAVDEACTDNPLGKTACQAAFQPCLGTAATKYLVTTLSADSAQCLVSGIVTGIGKAGRDGGTESDAGPGATSDAGTTPAPGTPACGPDTCAGCCTADGTCQSAGTTSACGRGGGACTTCAGGATCELGQCIQPTCKSTCTSGCCTSAGCQTGTTKAACGTSGNACAVCGSGQSCVSGTCRLDPATTFAFVAVGAQLPTKNLSGGDWDVLAGKPDALLKATSGATSAETASVDDTFTPVWNKTLLTGKTAAAFKASLRVDVYDADVAFNDLMGGCNVALDDAAFDGALHTVTCPASATGVALAVDYRLVH